jgi:hypothetical protein
MWSFSHGRLVSVDPRCDLHCLLWVQNGHFLEEQTHIPWADALDRKRVLSVFHRNEVGFLKTGPMIHEFIRQKYGVSSLFL